MRTGQIRDGLNYASKLTFRKILNGVKVFLSFYFSRMTKRVVHPAMPISISIEPTTACNLGCPECPSGLKMFSRETGNLQMKNAEHWIDSVAPFVTYINFYFQGEPFIHPNFLELVKLASAKRIYTSTSTNGHFLHHELARKTVESGLDRLIISIDGTTQEVYEKYRIHGKLEKVIQGTRNVIAWKKKLRSNKPFVIFQFLVVRPNEHQIEDAKKLCKELGVDDIRFKTAQVYDYENGNELIPLNEKYSRYKKTGENSYVIRSKMDDHCWRMCSGCVVTWDGKVVPCCFDKDATHQLGDLQEETLKSIWNGRKYRDFRGAIFRSRKDIDICANCSEGTQVWTN